MLFRYPRKQSSTKEITPISHPSCKKKKKILFMTPSPKFSLFFVFCELSQSPSLLVFYRPVLSFAGVPRQRSEGIQPVLSLCLCVLGGVILAEWGVGAGAGRGECWARHSERSQPGTTWTSASCSMGEMPTTEVGV